MTRMENQPPRRPRSGRLLVIAAPMAWLTIFLLIPLIVVAKIAFSEATIASPPYLPLLEWLDGGNVKLNLSLDSFAFLLTDHLYLFAYLNSLKIAAIATLCTLVIARSGRARMLLLLLVILPFWTSFLLRTYAWIGLLKNNGLINHLLLQLGIITEPWPMLHSEFAVQLGIIYTYLPFMVLPLYANLVKLDASLLEASADLGARPVTTFFTITLPLSLPGIIAGVTLVFIPAVGEFVIPALLGGSDTLMIGRVLWDEFFANRAWPVAAALAIAMLLFIMLPLVLLRTLQPAREAG